MPIRTNFGATTPIEVRSGASMVALAFLAIPGIAHAQEDVQAVSVDQRYREAFQTPAIPVGGFDLRPEVSVSAEYNDNVYAATDAANKMDDLIGRLGLDLPFSQTRPDRQLLLRAHGEIERYASLSSENTERFGVETFARLRRGTLTRPYIKLEYRRDAENRRSLDSIEGSNEPARYDFLSGVAGVDRDFGPFFANVEVAHRRLNYLGRTTLGDQNLNLDYRDRNVTEGSIRVGYSGGGHQAVYLQVTGNKRSYKVGPGTPVYGDIITTERGSKGVRVEAGYRLQVSQLIFVDGRAGYFVQNYDDPVLPTVKGLAFTASALWNVTPLTSLRFDLLRQVDETSSPELNGQIRSEAGLAIDHELLRNLILSAHGRYAIIDPRGEGQKFDQFQVGARARFLFGRRFELTVAGEHFSRSEVRPVQQNRLMLGVGVKF